VPVPVVAEPTDLLPGLSFQMSWRNDAPYSTIGLQTAPTGNE